MRFLVDAQLPPALARWLVAARLERMLPLIENALERGETLVELV